MSDQVFIAFIGMATTILPIILGFVIQLVKLLRKVNTELDDMRKEKKLDDVQIEAIRTGAFRQGHVAGVEFATGNSLPAELKADD